MKHGENVCLDKILNKFEKGSCRSKTRSLGQMLEKPCVHSRDQIFGLIFMKIGQSICIDEILSMFENGSCWVKK